MKRFKLSSFVSYVSVGVLIMSILSIGYSSNQQSSLLGMTNVAAEGAKKSAIDQVAAANLATTVAQSANIGVEANVANLSTSMTVQAELAQSNEGFASKPQITTENTRSILNGYKTKAGDTLPAIASAHGVSVDTIKWANNLSNDTIALDADLRIPSVDGVIYTVKEGDTPESIASKYGADKDRMVSFNNAELSGLKAGQQIVIPGGVLPENERPGYVAPRSNYSTGSSSIKLSFQGSGNGKYPFGWCTYYAAIKSGAGNWGNANTWDDGARATPGWTVSKIPKVGAIAQQEYTTGSYGSYGHVAIVDQVSADGTQIIYSDMNGIAGFGGVGQSGWVPVSRFDNYIYR